MHRHERLGGISVRNKNTFPERTPDQFKGAFQIRKAVCFRIFYRTIACNNTDRDTIISKAITESCCRILQCIRSVQDDHTVKPLSDALSDTGYQFPDGPAVTVLAQDGIRLNRFGNEIRSVSFPVCFQDTLGFGRIRNDIPVRYRTADGSSRKHKQNLYHVRTSCPSSVTATVISHCAEGNPSSVYTVQPSSSSM